VEIEKEVRELTVQSKVYKQWRASRTRPWELDT
jgi:hypothetical protein